MDKIHVTYLFTQHYKICDGDFKSHFYTVFIFYKRKTKST